MAKRAMLPPREYTGALAASTGSFSSWPKCLSPRGPGYSDRMSALFGLFSDGEAGDATAQGIHWGTSGQYRQFLKLAQVPKPAGTWLFRSDERIIRPFQ